MQTGYEKGSADNLPEISGEMIAQFFSKNPDYVSAEIQGSKATRATRRHYGDEAVGFVQLRREQSKCIIKARITPEHKVTKKDYNVTVLVNEEEKVIEMANCVDCVASEGGCKHTTAFLFWLHRRSEEPSVTSKACYWKATKLSKVVREKKFMKLSDLVDKKLPQPPASTGEFWQACFAIARNVGAQGMVFNIQNHDPLLLHTSLHHLAMSYEEMMAITQEDISADSFLTFCNAKMTNVFCGEAESKTRGQATSKYWSECRFGRITASRFHEASRCNTYDGILTEIIMGAGMPLKMEAVARGKVLEQPVLEIVGARMDLEIEKCGIFLSPTFPIFGASPDGISENFCFEVKCPAQEATVAKYLKNGEPTPAPYAQMQLQMHLTGKKMCKFCVASPYFERNNEVIIRECKYDEAFCLKPISECTEFWKKAIFPKLFNK